MRTNCSLALWIALLTVNLCLPVWAQVQPQTHYPITTRLVARALTYKGMETADEQVSLPTQVLATEPFPQLDLLSVEPLPNATTGVHEPRSSVKMACHTTTSCLPFFATVTGLQPAITPGNSAVIPNAPSYTVRAGTHAILIMDDSIAHIQVAVVTLENGAPGKWIRVASPDRKQYYRAEVIGATLLRGDF